MHARLGAALVAVAVTALGVVPLSACTTGTSTAGATSPTAGATPSRSTSAATAATPDAPATSSTAAPTTSPSPSRPGTPAPSAEARGVDVAVTVAGWNALTSSIEVGAYVPVVEPDGTCTLTATRGDDTATVTGGTVTDASSTSCSSLTLPGAEVSAGTWQLVVTYTSASSSGSSTPVSVEVP